MKRKTAVISGGARGIGRCLTRRFCELGYNVYVLDIDEEELDHTINVHLKQYSDSTTENKGKDDGDADKTSQQQQQQQQQQQLLGSSICNLRDTSDIREKISQAAEFLGGRIDVLINNGGIATPQWKDGKNMADKDTLAEWQAFIETNLTAPFAVSQAALPHMKHESNSTLALHASDSNAGPCIIHIGSFRAHQSDPHQEGYASSKAGLLGLMHSMAISLAEWGVRVNLIAPGRIKVAHECKQGDEDSSTWEQLNLDKDVQDHPTNRAGRPKDIADAAEYLVGAGFVTGQEIIVDGGASKKK